MKLATAGSRWSKKWKTEDWFWDQLLERLRTPARTGETMREYRAMSKDEQTAKKDVGGFVGGALSGGRRVAGSVTERWLVTLDEDYAEPGDWENFIALNDVRCCVYSTHSHTPEKPRLRWLFPLKRAVTPDEYPAVARKVAEWIGIEKMDTLTYQLERLMFWPSCCSDGEYLFHEQDGAALDPDAVLREYGPGEEWREAWRWPTSSREGEVVQREQKTQADPLTKDGIVGAFCRTYSVKDAIDAFDLPYERCDGLGGAGVRYTYTRGSTAAGAVVYGEGRWLYSNHATDPAGGMLCNAWDLVRVHKFGDLDADARTTDPTKLPSWKRMAELAGADTRVRGAMIDSQFGDLGTIAPMSEKTALLTTTKTTPNDGDETDDGDVDADESWKDELTTDKKTGKIDPTINNACLILMHSDLFRDRLAWSSMGDLIYVTKPMPWKHPSDPENRLAEERRIMGEDWNAQGQGHAQGREGGAAAVEYHGPPQMQGRLWDEQDRIELYKLFENLGYKATQKTNGMLDNALKDAAQEHMCNPIKDYLLGLTWDGVERLDTMFIYWLGAEDCRLNREITRLWMMGAVDRVMRPGCKFDSVLVFCGEQGIGKTSLLEKLAGDYFTNSVSAISSERSTVELLQGKWIVELGELDSVKKSDSSAFKTFISKRFDDFRKPYAVDAVKQKRQCLFAGTTNEMSFLRDDTGERRYWLMPCAGQAGMAEIGRKGTLPGFAETVPQIWAEAVVRWRERIRKCRKPNEPLEAINADLFITDPELDAEMEARRSSYKLVDTVRDDLEDYLDKARPHTWEDMNADERLEFFEGLRSGFGEVCDYYIRYVTLKEIRVELFHERPEDACRGGRSTLANRVSAIMDSMPSWERVGKGEGPYGRSAAWKKR